MSVATLPAPAAPVGVTGGSGDWRTEIPEARRRHLRVWLATGAAMTFLILVIGGITRLTQSGLSIVDWAPIMGVVPPLSEAQWVEAFDRYREFPEYQVLRRGMSMDEFKFIFFWEYLHRLAARAIGVAFLVPFLVFWARGYFNRPLLGRVGALFLLGAAQGVMGWYMVMSGLVDDPAVSHYRLAAHLSIALLILGWCVWLMRELSVAPGARAAAEPGVRRWVAVLGVLTAVQIVWGAFVAGLRAGLFYNTFPLMAGQLLPPTGLSPGVSLREIAANPTLVQWVHRLLGTVLLAATAVFFVRVRRVATDPQTRGFNAALLALMAGQYALGVLTLVYQVPVALGVAHQAVAVVIVGVWVAWLHQVRSREVDGTAREGALSRAPLERAERSTAYVGAGLSRPEHRT
jgi:heme a synthase